MNEIGTFNLILLALIIVALIVLYIITKLKNDEPIEVKSKAPSEPTIYDLLKIASDKSSSKEKLKDTLYELVDNFAFPSKKNGVVPKEAKPFLDFMDLLASHKNADARLIVLASKEIKKKNSDYSKEIDICEQTGISRRK